MKIVKKTLLLLLLAIGLASCGITFEEVYYEDYSIFNHGAYACSGC